MTDQIFIGPHSIGVEESTGIILMKQVGQIEGEHAEGIQEAFKKFSQPGKPMFIIANNVEATGVSPEARKVFGRSQAENSEKGYICAYGGSFAMRVLVNLVMKAMALAGSSVGYAMVADEAEAREWIDKQMKKEGVR